MKLGLLGALGAVVGLSLVASPASATIYLDGAAGHYYAAAANIDYKDMYAYTYNLRIYDGRGVFIGTPNQFSTNTAEWVVHIPIDATDRTWYAMGRGPSTGINHNSQKICAYDVNGLFSGCGSPQDFGAWSSTYVPSGGTAMSVTDLMSECTNGYCGPSGTLFQVRAHS